MGRLGKFVALSPAERRLLVGAAGLLATVRVALWVLPFGWVHGVVRALGRRRQSRNGETPPVERIVWAVGAAALLVPRATCLVRALAVVVRGQAHVEPLGREQVSDRLADAGVGTGDHGESGVGLLHDVS
jgi:hypothetical protein